MRLSYIPGQTFEGRVIYVYPYLDARSRQGRVRLEFENPHGVLKPGMYAHVEITSTLAQEVTLALLKSYRRHLHQYWPRDSCPRHPAAMANRSVDFVPPGGAERPFHDRRGDRHLVDVVQLVCVLALEPDAAGEHEHGDVIEVRLGDTGEGVGEAGSRHDVYTSHPARGSPVAIGHEGR